ncbi:hypothetical protein GCM10028799_77330 [Kribbella italica]
MKVVKDTSSVERAKQVARNPTDYFARGRAEVRAEARRPRPAPNKAPQKADD